MIRRPSTTTLFPYTTRFRSFRKLMRESENWNSLANDRFIKLMLINPLQKYTKKIPPHFSLPLLTQPLPHFTPNRDIMELLEQQDRKSTRLNSSHVKISYAVF